MNDFLDRMSDILETSVTPEMKFRSVSDWSSLTAFAILVTLENVYGRRMTIAELEKMETIADLASACGAGGVAAGIGVE